MPATTAYPPTINRLAEWLAKNAPGCAIMQCNDELNAKGERQKKPVYPHKKGNAKGDWTADSYLANPPTDNWAILLDDMMVVDFDDSDAMDAFMERFPDDFAHHDQIVETTTHGTHYYFNRPDGVFNKIGACDKVDIKAIELTGTRSTIVCAPSPNKEWVCAPWDGVLYEPSQALTEWLRSLIKAPTAPSVPLMEDVKKQVKKLLSGVGSVVPFDIAKRVVEGLDASRAESYATWSVGIWAIAGCGFDEAATWDLFELFSEKSPKYTPGGNEAFYTDALNRATHSYTFGTLKYWLKTDNLSTYDKIMEDDINSIIDVCVSNEGAHFDTARVVDKLIGDAYVYVADATPTNWHFAQHRWSGSKDWSRLSVEMSTTVVK